MAEATHELPQGKKVIKIGVQKPRFVFGYAPPDSTIQKWLARGYTHGHVAPGQVLRAFVPISMIVTAIWATGSFLVGYVIFYCWPLCCLHFYVENVLEPYPLNGRRLASNTVRNKDLKYTLLTSMCLKNNLHHQILTP